MFIIIITTIINNIIFFSYQRFQQLTQIYVKGGKMLIFIVKEKKNHQCGYTYKNIYRMLISENFFLKKNNKSTIN